jgi:methionyl-tRNA synthetase
MAKKFYITTAIDYVNAKPHIGHAFEKVLADAISRWKKLKGEEVYFLTGTDENAQKNVQAAKLAGIPTKKFVDKNSKLFIELCKKLDIDYDDFIRTTEKRHTEKSQEIFKKVYDKGEIYKGNYEGHYCYGCESFKTEKDLVDGKCAEHDKKPEWLSEETYFFKLSKYKNKLIKFVEKYIVPKSKKNEILSRLKNENLRDLSVSRTNLEWGIDSSVDKKFKIYVWFDALINYISGANGNWPADVHVVGKGINWFHSVIWPAILISSDYKLPKTLLVHGYLNIKGKKMSKSLGNVIDPVELIEKYGSDSVRYSLFRCSVFDDSDYSEELLIKRHNDELADKLGNLVSRVSTLAEKYGIEKNKKWGIPFQIPKFEKDFEKHMNNYEFDKALNVLFSFIDILNGYVQNERPWAIHEEDFKKAVLYNLVLGVRTITPYLEIFVPQASKKISKTFKTDKIKKSEILFKKIK